MRAQKLTSKKKKKKKKKKEQKKILHEYAQIDKQNHICNHVETHRQKFIYMYFACIKIDAYR